VAHAVDVDVVGGVGQVVDLEADRLAVVDADVGGEALDARVAGAGNPPNVLRGPGQLVLGDDRVDREQLAPLQAFQQQPGPGGARTFLRGPGAITTARSPTQVSRPIVTRGHAPGCSRIG